MKYTKAQWRELAEGSIGTGVLTIKTDRSAFLTVRVCTIKGVLCRVGDGKPVFPITISEYKDDDDDSWGVDVEVRG